MFPEATGEASEYAVEEILRDGGSILIRAIRPDDKELLLEHFRSLSADSVYLRFLGSKKELSPAELTRLTEVDFVRHVALAATLRVGDREKIIGVGRSIVSRDDAPHRAEVAFAVLDAHQGRGVGTLLLEHLARLARAAGVTEFEADTLGVNRKMLEVFARSGFEVKRTVSTGIVHVSFPTGETEHVREVSLTRQRHAAAQSLRPFLNPRAVALIGASRRPGTIGRALLDNLVAAGFRGALYPVNPKTAEIDGRRCYPDVAAIGAPVDLAIVAVPAAHVEEAIRDCAAAGVRGVVVISSGFAESSPEGRDTEKRLTELVRRSGMRMIGPNCMGILNTDPEVQLNATFSPVWPPAGNIGMLSQSGALGIAILDVARTRKIGLSTFVSVGNKADVSGNDLLCYWAEDPHTDVVVLYLESFGNPRKFARLAPEIARQKPVVAMKSGRSAAGTRAASSHSAALASLDIAVDALFEQAGVIRTATLEELFDVVSLLSNQPLPPGRRVAVVTNAGGPGILFADACEAHGLELPEPSAACAERLRRILPPQAGLSNPIDMIASAGPEEYESVLEAVGEDDVFDAVAAIYIPPMVTEPEAVARAIARGAGRVPPQKPVLSVFLSSAGPPPALHEGPRGALPTYVFPENAAIALSAAERYARWRERPRGQPMVLDAPAQDRIREIVDGALRGAAEPFWLAPDDVASLLEAVGLRTAASERTTVEGAPAAAERLGYPLVAKAIAAGILHKSDVGGVILGLHSAEEVAEAADTLRARIGRAGATLEGVLLQREIAGGLEALVGMTRDPTFGPLLVCGLGGVLVEVLRDASFRLTPVTDVDARDMVDRLRSRRLLDGYRGAPPGDREALVDVILRISALVELVPELRELDLNPVKVLPPGEGAVVVDARLRLGPPTLS